MSCRCNACCPACPPVTVTIQPPPFVLSIPGPTLYRPSEPVCIKECNPCIEEPNPCAPIPCLEVVSYEECDPPSDNSSAPGSPSVSLGCQQKAPQSHECGCNPCHWV